MGIHTGSAIVRRHKKLDSLNPGSVILDERGHAWQSDSTYWYRAYGDDSMISSWDLAQIAGAVIIVHAAPKSSCLSFRCDG